MSEVHSLNKYAEGKQKTNKDVRQKGPIVHQYDPAIESTADQTVINLVNFVVDTSNDDLKEQFRLVIDGKRLTEGASNDFVFSNIVGGLASQITLNSPLAAGLNIHKEIVGVEIAPLPNASSVQATLNNDVAQPLPFSRGFETYVKEEMMTPVNAAPSAGQFRSDISGRADIPDDSKMLKPLLGIERIRFNAISELKSEFGSNDEQVWELDTKDARIRFVGANWKSSSPANGMFVQTETANTDEYMEVVFYGTGLNMLMYGGNPGDYRPTIDGGAEGANFYQDGSAILGGRNYKQNVVQKVVSGLSLDWHTIKMRQNNGGLNFNTYGCEILNESTQIKFPIGEAYAGAAKQELLALASSDYNEGVVGTRGARVRKYLKDGVISGAVQEVDATQKNMDLADHSNEILLRKINFREFGANRADDFSTLSSTRDSAFTLDDGTTTLVCSSVNVNTANYPDVLAHGVANGETILTFVGTGLDITYRGLNAALTTGFFMEIDGVDIGFDDTQTFHNSGLKRMTICSGLPYGTHTFKFSNGPTPPEGLGFAEFLIYGPKKPSIPQDAIELADYNVMADYVHNTTRNVSNISTGILRKGCTREMVYVEGTGGTSSWTFQVGFGESSQYHRLETNRLNSYFEYTFFGTGFDWRFPTWVSPSGTTAATVFVDGLALSIGNFPSATITSSMEAPASFDSNTGIFDQISTATQGGNSIAVSGLALGYHTIKINNDVGSAGTYLRHDCFDVITPIHVNNTKVGSLALEDTRKFSPLPKLPSSGVDLSKAKAWIVYDEANSKIMESMNISAVIDFGAGNHKFFFTKPFKNPNYVVAGASGQNVFVSVQERYSHSCSFTNYSSAGGLTDALSSVVFFGELADESQE